VWLSARVRDDLADAVQQRYPSVLVYRDRAAMLIDLPLGTLPGFREPRISERGRGLIRIALMVFLAAVAVIGVVPTVAIANAPRAALWLAALAGSAGVTLTGLAVRSSMVTFVGITAVAWMVTAESTTTLAGILYRCLMLLVAAWVGIVWLRAAQPGRVIREPRLDAAVRRWRGQLPGCGSRAAHAPVDVLDHRRGSAALAAAASPLLASWSAALADGDTSTWWRPRKVDAASLAVVAAAALGFGALAGGGPWPVWWLIAACGTVLAVFDAQRSLLAARLVYPLALLEAAVLVIDAVTTHDVAALARAGLAALIVGAGWFLLPFAAGGGVGLGDTRVATLTAGLLGWLGWTAMMRAQLITGPARRGHGRRCRRRPTGPTRPRDAGPDRASAGPGQPAHVLDLVAARRSCRRGDTAPAAPAGGVNPAEDRGHRR
jgi:hypothetical protein